VPRHISGPLLGLRPVAACLSDYRPDFAVIFLFITYSLNIVDELERDHLTILGLLGTKGLASAKELQEATGKSQPTVARLLGDLSAQVLALGRGRSRLYGLPKSIRGLPAQQAIYWVDEAGLPQQIGQLSLLAADKLYVELGSSSVVSQGALPWFLAPLRAQGFLGRLLAQHLSNTGIDTDPERWPLESVLFAALHLHDAPGALIIGDILGRPPVTPHVVPSDMAARARALDKLAANVAGTLPAGSSAGGEQPKFLAAETDGRHVLVKFTPPRGTPFGDRWHDLLHAEALALDVLGQHGVASASCSVVSTQQRTYLISDRFDRVGAKGRRHVVSVGAAHAGFVAGGYNHWAATCDELARQKRLAPADAMNAQLLLHFGRLIGNTDMHSGNLSLLVSADKLPKGHFTLAPAYDMLPMRWRPDPMLGGALDYAPFEPDVVALSGPARPIALVFWSGLAQHGEVSQALRGVAASMVERLRDWV